MSREANADLRSAAMVLLANGELLQCVALLRRELGCSLPEARAWVDAQLEDPQLPGAVAVSLKLHALDSVAFELCSAVRDGELAEAELEGQLRQRCPGLSDEQYSRAIAEGYRDSL